MIRPNRSLTILAAGFALLFLGQLGAHGMPAGVAELTEVEAAQSWTSQADRVAERNAAIFRQIPFQPRRPLGFDAWQELRQSDNSLDLIFIVDRSGSMDPAKMSAAKRALMIFIQSLKDEDRFAVIAFGDQPQLISEMGPGTASNRHQGLARVDQIASGGGTLMGKAMEASLPIFGAAPRRPTIVLMTDGVVQDRNLVEQVAVLCKQKGIRIISIAFGRDADENLLRTIAIHTDGDYYPASDFDLELVYGRAAKSLRGYSDMALWRDTIRNGEDPQEYKMQVFPGSNAVELQVLWEGSEVFLELVHPSGRTIDIENLSPDEREYICPVRKGNRLDVRILAPDPGDWKARLRGQNLKPQGERINFAASVDRSGAYRLALLENKAWYNRHDDVLIGVKIEGAVPDKAIVNVMGTPFDLQNAGNGIHAVQLSLSKMQQVQFGFWWYRISVSMGEAKHLLYGVIQIGSDAEIIASQARVFPTKEQIAQMRMQRVFQLFGAALNRDVGGAIDAIQGLSTLSEMEKEILGL